MLSNHLALAALLALLPQEPSAPSPASSPAAKTAAPQALASPRMPLHFVPNEGQWPGEVRFLAQAKNFSTWCYEDRIVVSRAEGEQEVAVALRFRGAARRPLAERPLAGHVSFLVGAADTWRSKLAISGAVRYPELWPGIDLLVYDGGGEIEYDLELAPGADLDAVGFEVEGAAGANIDASGALVVATALGELRQAKPKTWELAPDGSPRPIACAFELRAEGSYGFRAEGRDARLPLVVDPVLVWGTYLGVSSSPVIAVDASGAVFVAGGTSSVVPTTTGAYRTSNPGGSNGFVAKLDPTAVGSAQLVWCTYLGGNSNDLIRSIDLAANGEIALGGSTFSTNFPTTAGALDSVRNTGTAGFVAKLSSDGASLLFATLIDGTNPISASTQVNRVLLEPDGKIVAACITQASGVPTSANAYQTTMPFAGIQDLWLGRLDPFQSGAAQLLWGTYLGSSTTVDFLVSSKLSTHSPGVLGFVFHSLDATGIPRDYTTGLLYGSDWLFGQFDMNATGSAQRRVLHAVGGALGGNDVPHDLIEMPTGDWLVCARLDATSRLVRFSPDGSTILGDLSLGGRLNEASIAWSASAGVTVVGSTSDSGFPVTPNGPQPTYGGGSTDAYLCQWDATLTNLRHATYMGGGDGEHLLPGSATLVGNTLTCAFFTQSAGLPISNAFQSALHASGSDTFLLRLDLSPATARAPRDLEFLDLDGDGDLDVATANESSNDLDLYTNDGAGTLGAARARSLGAGAAAPVALAACDLDADGARDDLAVVCEGSSSLVLVTNPDSATPTLATQNLSGLRVACVASGDLDADPIDELVVGCLGEPFAGGAGLFVVRNGGAATSVAIPAAHPQRVAKLALGDLDGDGDLDLAALAQGPSDALLLFAGDGAGGLVFAGAFALASSGLANGLCLADLDRDGRLDLAVAETQLFPPAETLRVFRRTSAGALSTALFSAAPGIALPGSFALDLACGDLEDDSIPGFFGRMDLAVANAGSGDVRVLHGFTGSAFLSSSSPSSGTNPVAVALGDLDGDGCADLVIANRDSDDVTVHLSAPPALTQSYGTGCGGPSIAAEGVPVPGAAAFTVRVLGARPASPAFLFFSSATADVALPPSACRLLVASPWTQLLVFTNGAGEASLPLAIPPLVELLGADVYTQAAVFRVPGGAFADTLDLSDALRVQVGS